MFSKSIILALAAASVASAQTFTNCNPMKKSKSTYRPDQP
jgi:hypothetical protein